MKDWDYAIFSHIASSYGGPEKYIEQLKINTIHETVTSINKKWIKGTIPTLLILIPLATKGVITIGQECTPKIKNIFNKINITHKEQNEIKKQD